MCKKLWKEHYVCCNGILKTAELGLFQRPSQLVMFPSLCIRIPSGDWNQCLHTWAPALGIQTHLVSVVFCHFICSQNSSVTHLCCQVWEWQIWTKGIRNICNFVWLLSMWTQGLSSGNPHLMSCIGGSTFPPGSQPPLQLEEGYEWGFWSPELSMGTEDPRTLRSQGIAMPPVTVVPTTTF